MRMPITSQVQVALVVGGVVAGVATRVVYMYVLDHGNVS